ncbi:MAG: ClpXP protease specificity-enhancing factor [Sterolibacterium sp.]|jgi:stringent starvation protein B
MAEIPSTKPYLIRAIHEWCLDQGYTPYLAVSVDARTRVPREHVKDGQIVLNLGPEATHQLVMGNDLITFSARFNGVAQALSIPVENIAAIYARENGQGMAFEVAAPVAGAVQPAEPRVDELPPAPTGRPHLTRIK